MDGLNQTGSSGTLLSASSDGSSKSSSNKSKNERPKLSFKDEIRTHFIGRWSYDSNNNMPGGVISEAVRKAQFALSMWTAELITIREKQDRKKEELREYWTGVYQIIGFYSVFQGVIFQGVTTMSSLLRCGFYKVPVILSVLASAATFLGIYLKFDKVLKQTRSLYDDYGVDKVLESKIEHCYTVDVNNFIFEEVEEEFRGKDRSASEFLYDQELYKAKILKWGVLVFLLVFSALFAYLDYIVMCRGYY